MIVVNGKAYRQETVALDEGLQFGRGVFETLLVDDAPQSLAEHLKRMHRGLAALGIARRIEEQEIWGIIREFGLRHGILKIMVTAENVIVMTRENRLTPVDYERGYRLKVSAIRRNPTSPSVFIKSMSFLDNILAREEAQKQCYDDALLLNMAGQVTEGASCNIFWSKHGTLYTPAQVCGLLDGITRGRIMASRSVQEGAYTLEDLYDADEVFVTSSVLKVMRVAAIDEKVYPPASSTAGSMHSGNCNF